MERIDIHRFYKKYSRLNQTIEKAEISHKNNAIIKRYKTHCEGKGLGEARIIKIIYNLIDLAKFLNMKDLDKVETNDLEGYLGRLNLSILTKNGIKKTYSEWTKQSHRLIIKRFYKWLLGNDEDTPACVKFIKCTINDTKLKKLKPSDLMTVEEIQKVIEIAENPRDKALISTLYESGSRIGELGSLRICDIIFDKYGILINVRGKTGETQKRLGRSSEYLRKWLNVHPYRFEPDSPLWIELKGMHKKELSYGGLKKIITTLAEKAGIKGKKVNPHSYRHRRATDLAKAGVSEAVMKEFMIWKANSEMARFYIHLSKEDVDRAILKLYGITKEDEDKLKPAGDPIKCPRCSVINPSLNEICFSCNLIFSQYSNEVKEKDILSKQITMLLEHPLLKEAIEKINNDKNFKEQLKTIN